MTTYKDERTSTTTSRAGTPFHYEIQEIGSVLNIRMRGELDLAVVEECRLGLEEPLRDAGRIVVLDVGAVTFVDSTGLSLLLRTKRTVDANGGRMLIARVSRPVLRLLEASGTLSMFDYLDGDFVEATCPVCDATIADDAPACPACGAV
jgi:anti-anti-sigma factor